MISVQTDRVLGEHRIVHHDPRVLVGGHYPVEGGPYVLQGPRQMERDRLRAHPREVQQEHRLVLRAQAEPLLEVPLQLLEAVPVLRHPRRQPGQVQAALVQPVREALAGHPQERAHVMKVPRRHGHPVDPQVHRRDPVRQGVPQDLIPFPPKVQEAVLLVDGGAPTPRTRLRRILPRAPFHPAEPAGPLRHGRVPAAHRAPPRSRRWDVAQSAHRAPGHRQGLRPPRRAAGWTPLHAVRGPPAPEHPHVPAHPALYAYRRAAPGGGPAAGAPLGSVLPSDPHVPAHPARVAPAARGVPQRAPAHGAPLRPLRGPRPPLVVALDAVADFRIRGLEYGVPALRTGVGDRIHPPGVPAEPAHSTTRHGVVPPRRTTSGACARERIRPRLPEMAAAVAVQPPVRRSAVPGIPVHEERERPFLYREYEYWNEERGWNVLL